MAQPLFKADGIARRSASSLAWRVDGFSLAPGEAAVWLGESGAGKSSVLAACLGLASRSVEFDGVVEFDGSAWPPPRDSERRRLLRERICVLPQDAHAAFDPLERIGPQIERAVGAEHARRLRDVWRELDRDVGLLAHRPHELSGGQLRSALLAIAVLRGADFVVADEPTVGLDSARSRVGCDALRRRGASLLVATHDRWLVDALGATEWCLEGGRLSRGAPAVVAWPRAAAPDPGDVILELDRIEFAFGRDIVLRDLSIEVRRGVGVAVVGASGAGKTTLARILMGRLEPTRGRVVRNGRIQLVSQDSGGSLTPHRSVRELIDEVRSADFDVAAESERIGLPAGALDRRPHQLSGGERRRVALLRALSVQPDGLILDEPTADLDRETAVDVVGMLLACQRRTRVGMLWITHDHELARAACSHVVTLNA